MHDPGPTFRMLHRPGNPFVLANCWDVGSARLLAALGAEALATSSAAHAFTLGKPDGAPYSGVPWPSSWSMIACWRWSL